MKDIYRVAVIGGGIVGASVLYHLARLGWTDIVLVERAELTAGSTWHAAAGFHAQNDNLTLARTQARMADLYRRIERESGQPVGLHVTGGIALAATPERWEMLLAEHSKFQGAGLETRLMTPAEIGAACPIVDTGGVIGGLYDPNEGYVDPHGATHAFAKAARHLGAEVLLRTAVTALNPARGGGWTVVTDKGRFHAGAVVNAAGLWARRVGRMAGTDLPLVPLEHHYLVTDDVPVLAELGREIPSITDLEGFTYLQPERKGVILGVYERNPRHWSPEGAPWDYGMTLLPPDIDRVMPELSIGYGRFPPLAAIGIRKWVNGAFTFTPDGNPLIGPVPGLRDFWVACGCMAGFSQSGGIGEFVARWIVDDDPGEDVFGMDVARFGPYATRDDYLLPVTAQFYARRFVLSYPNEQLLAGRPAKTSAVHDILSRQGAVFGVNWGLETPEFFAAGTQGFLETPTFRRSNAHDHIAAEVRAVRTAAGIFDSSCFARYDVAGPGAADWLDRLLSCRLPVAGRMRLAPLLSEAGRLMGDLTVSRLSEDRFWLVGSYYLQAWHMRWFSAHMPASGVALTNLSDDWAGFAISGPAARQIVAAVAEGSVEPSDLPFFGVTEMAVAGVPAVMARVSLTGELGFEVNVRRTDLPTLYQALLAAGGSHGLRPIGNRALDSLRLEKNYGIWNAEFTQEDSPLSSYLGAFVDTTKPDFIGKAAVLEAAKAPPRRRLVFLRLAESDAEAPTHAPVRTGNRIVGEVRASAWGHHVGASLASACVDRDALEDGSPLTVDVLGRSVSAWINHRPPYDPEGTRLRL
jgi:dimethylglycine dehydrogenase